MQVKLTDQALVAVALARGHAAAGGRQPHVADLVVGIATEPEGVAGRRLSACSSAITMLADRSASAPPRLPASDVALRWAAGDVGDRPAGTVDLLLAALEVGAGDLADMLGVCGLPPEALAAGERPARAPLRSAAESDALSETYGLDPASTEAEPAAARAMARTRAVGGGALTLLAALAVEAATDPHGVPLDADTLTARMAGLPDRGERPVSEPPDGDWDNGVEAVVEAAWLIRDRATQLRALDLLRSAALVGGRGAAHMLAPDVED